MISEFLKKEASGGIIMMIAAVLAMIFANSALEKIYLMFLSTPVEIKIGALEIAKPLLLWINDGLMAVFFFLIGLELKREMMEGELSDKKNIILPGIGAVGGMLFPALIYVLFNLNDPVALQGWAIPAATDIAFALGILALIGSRVPLSLKLFLTSLAIFDDIGAILIIAFFYTSKMSLIALGMVFVFVIVLVVFNRMGIVSKSPYLLIGILMWVAMLKSGVHATLAGVVLAMFIPLRGKEEKSSPLKELEHDLHHIVAFFILPVFAFANAGIALKDVTMEQALHGVPVGIA
ncbi:Na+/H+ antiporter NhaA, partial [Candidatus Parcubacteria bacterium]